MNSVDSQNIQNIKLQRPLYFQAKLDTIWGALLFWALTEGITILGALWIGYEEFIPSRLAILGNYVGLFIVIRLILYSYKSLTGDDLRSQERMEKISDTKQIKLLFNDENEATKWVFDIKKMVYSSKVYLFSLASVLIIMVIQLISEFLTVGHITIVDYIIQTPNDYIFASFYFFKLWIQLAADVALVCLVIAFLVGINNLGKEKYRLTLHELIEFMSLKSQDKDESYITQDFEKGYRMSLFLFKRNCKPIASLMTKIALFMLASFIVASSYLYFFVIVPGTNAIFPIVFLGMLILEPILVILAFLWPQYNLHKLLQSTKEDFLASLWSLQEIHRFRFIDQLKAEAIDKNNQAENISTEKLAIIEKLVSDTESLLTWPFDYKQIGSIIIGSSSIFSPIAFDFILGNFSFDFFS